MRPQRAEPDRGEREQGTGPAGAWPPPPPQGSPPGNPPFDPATLFAMLDGVRRAAPGPLRDQATNLIREFLLTLRSLIDWYLERLDNPRREPEIEDIPIE